MFMVLLAFASWVMCQLVIGLVSGARWQRAGVCGEVCREVSEEVCRLCVGYAWGDV